MGGECCNQKNRVLHTTVVHVWSLASRMHPCHHADSGEFFSMGIASHGLKRSFALLWLGLAWAWSGFFSCCRRSALSIVNQGRGRAVDLCPDVIDPLRICGHGAFFREI